VGASYQINGRLFTVIGVTLPGFYGAKFDGWGMPDIWIPANTEPLLDGEASASNAPIRSGSTSLAACAPARIPSRSKQSCASSSMTGWRAMCPT
jgi:hypothetical protein